MATRWCAPAASPRRSTTTASPTDSRSICTRSSWRPTASGPWCSRGMNDRIGLARRYHWHSANVRDFSAEPHTGIAGAHQGTIMNLVDAQAAPAQERC